MHPNFAYLKELYNIELGKAQKLTYKLSHKVLHPQSIDKTNVKLSGAVFHESTANGLDYYAANGYPHFKDTAEFVNIVKNWFNCVKVKTPDYGIRKTDTILEPVHQNNKKSKFAFLQSYSKWFARRYEDHGKMNGPSAITHTTNALVPLLKSFLSDRGLNYVLLGNISSDYLEKRFGWYRQLCGANYFNSVPQFLQA